MIIKNGMVFNQNFKFEKSTVFIESGEIVDCAQYQDDEVIDATGCYVVPGLIDIHFHGCAGYDFCDATKESLEKIAEYELSQGITAICPASMTFSESRLTDIFSNAAAYHGKTGADLVGINMEGPFISEEKKAAQNATYIHKPDVDMFNRLQNAAGGLIKLVDIAPEVENAMEFIRQVSPQVRVSLAHTAASYEKAMEAFKAGASHVTHLYNAMAPFSHRSPGVLGAVYDFKDAMAELICDKTHLSPTTIRMTFELLKPERIIMISDSMMATGLSNGSYSLGGQAVTVKDGVATLTGTNALAGSVTNLMDCLRNLVQNVGIPFESALRCATYNPAVALGIDASYGSIAPGKNADVLILDANLEIVYVIKNGIARMIKN